MTKSADHAMSNKLSATSQMVLTLSCVDKPGIVHAVAEYLHGAGCNIVDSQQFADSHGDRFFMRVHAVADESVAINDVGAGFIAIAERFGMEWQLRDWAKRARVLIMVSQYGHCLNDLLFRAETGNLDIEVAAVVSNHSDFAGLSRWHGTEFHHIPVSQENRQDAEQKLLTLIKQLDIDVVILARYMQILSDSLCAELAGRAINIHHSFLPSFKGARPYHQAYERGVKLIGATAHYVTADLDEGPIIEQEVQRVDHSVIPSELAAMGRDVECLALARAVRWHVQHRVLRNGSRTVIFR